MLNSTKQYNFIVNKVLRMYPDDIALRNTIVQTARYIYTQMPSPAEIHHRTLRKTITRDSNHWYRHLMALAYLISAESKPPSDPD